MVLPPYCGDARLAWMLSALICLALPYQSSDGMTHRLWSYRPLSWIGALGVVASAWQGLPASAAPTLQVHSDNITEAQVLQAQKGWCNALLRISAAYASGGMAKARAAAAVAIDQAYAYQYGPVAFKPTLTSGRQTFRTSREGALAYFVGSDPDFPADKGFALKPWRSCQVVNQVIRLSGSQAITMGNVIFTDAAGKVTTVDKTWAFEKEADGSVRIVLHHSSLPFES